MDDSGIGILAWLALVAVMAFIEPDLAALVAAVGGLAWTLLFLSSLLFRPDFGHFAWRPWVVGPLTCSVVMAAGWIEALIGALLSVGGVGEAGPDGVGSDGCADRGVRRWAASDCCSPRVGALRGGAGVAARAGPAHARGSWVGRVRLGG